MKESSTREALHDAFYLACRQLLIPPVLILTRARYFNRPPAAALRGGVLIAANHQSYLDPVLVGMAWPVRIHYLARESLFRFPVFGALLHAISVHPYGRGRVDRAGLRSAMEILRGNRPLLVFPEGTRTTNGSLGRFRHGVGGLAARCGVPILPACIAGTFECWSRWRLLPRPRRVAVAFGDMISPAGRSADALTDETVKRIKELKRFLDEYLRQEREGP